MYDETEVSNILIKLYKVDESLACEEAHKAYYWADLGQYPIQIAQQIHRSLDHE